MAIEKVREYLKKFGADGRIMEFDVSSATVELAAVAVGTEPRRIAKTMAFSIKEKYILIVCAGDVKIDNHKYKSLFGAKAKMLTPEETACHIGHAVGGVCPFAVPDEVEIYLDESLRRFETVFPACGSSNSAIEVTLSELEKFSGSDKWIDVCRLKEEIPV